VRKLFLSVLLCMWIFTPVASHAANIIDNPSFEGGLESGPWTFTGFYSASSYSYDGVRSLFLGSLEPSTASQTIATTPRRKLHPVVLANEQYHPCPVTHGILGERTCSYTYR